MGENGDPDALVGLGELTSRHSDARGMLLLGKAALNRGLPFDHYAYPVNGIPSFKQIGPEVEPSVVYSIARQESAFNPAVVSPAQAYGLMQVTPDAGRYVCKRAGVSFDLNRMKTDLGLQRHAWRRRTRRAARGLPRLLHPDLRRLQCRPRQRQEMDRALRRSARSQGRRGRLGRADPVLRDAQLRAADHGEPAGLSRAVRRRDQAPDRSRPASRRQRRIANSYRLHGGLPEHFGRAMSRLDRLPRLRLPRRQPLP